MKDGRVSVRLRGYLLIETKIGFRLSAYLRTLSCRLTLSEGKDIDFDEVGFTEDLEAEYKFNTMVHGFSASAVTDLASIRNTVAKLRLDYHISFTGHPTEEPDCLELIVPVLRRPTVYGKW